MNITEEEAFEIMKLANQSSGSNSCNGSRSLVNGNLMKLLGAVFGFSSYMMIY